MKQLQQACCARCGVCKCCSNCSHCWLLLLGVLLLELLPLGLLMGSKWKAEEPEGALLLCCAVLLLLLRLLCRSFMRKLVRN